MESGEVDGMADDDDVDSLECDQNLQATLSSMFGIDSIYKKQYIAQRLLDDFMDFESEPGAFYYMCKMMGAKDIFVKEIFDLEQTKLNPSTYGIIFLFDYGVKSSMKRAKCPSLPVRDEDFVNNIFFSHQVADDSCATNAILCCLLNNGDIEIGDLLKQFKQETFGMTPTEKGKAIKNNEVLRFIHNIQVGDLNYYKCKKAGLWRMNTRSLQRGSTTKGKQLIYAGNGTKTRDIAYHYSCFIPIRGRLYELDGMDKYPIDYGAHDENNWTITARKVITDKIKLAINSNVVLMSVEPSLFSESAKKTLTLLKRKLSQTADSIQKTIEEDVLCDYLQPKYEDTETLYTPNCLVLRTGECLPISWEVRALKHDPLLLLELQEELCFWTSPGREFSSSRCFGVISDSLITETQARVEGLRVEGLQWEVADGKTDGKRKPLSKNLQEAIVVARSLKERYLSMKECRMEEHLKITLYRTNFNQRIHDYRVFFAEFFERLADHIAGGTLQFLCENREPLKEEVKHKLGDSADLDVQHGLKRKRNNLKNKSYPAKKNAKVSS